MNARNLSTNKVARSVVALLLAVTILSLVPGCKQPDNPPSGPPGGPGQTNPPQTPPPQVNVPPTPPAVVPAHSVNADKELIIRDLRVVESTRATRVGGPWHIGTLFSNMT